MILQEFYSTTDVHVAGEVFRLFDDIPFIQYESLKELDEQLPNVFSKEIALLLNEPRGFAGINGCLVVPPISRNSDAAAVFFNHEKTLPIHYGGVVAVVTALLESGKLKEKSNGTYLIETVHGVIPVVAFKKKEQVVSVSVEIEDCSVLQTGVPLLDSSYAVVQADHRYAVFDKSATEADIGLSDLSALKKWGINTIQALKSTEIEGVILMDEAALAQGKIKTVTFREDGWIVRSPGFGSTVACFAYLLSKGRVKPDLTLINESVFESFLESKAQYINGKYQFSMCAKGFITGMQTFVLDPTDPLPGGFLIK